MQFPDIFKIYLIFLFYLNLIRTLENKYFDTTHNEWHKANADVFVMLRLNVFGLMLQCFKTLIFVTVVENSKSKNNKKKKNKNIPSQKNYFFQNQLQNANLNHLQPLQTQNHDIILVEILLAVQKNVIEA